MKLDKKQNRLRRARKARAKIHELAVNRLSVHRTPRHIYAQIIAPNGDQVLASASTLDESLRKGNTGNVEAAGKVGTLIAERAKAAGVMFGGQTLGISAFTFFGGQLIAMYGPVAGYLTAALVVTCVLIFGVCICERDGERLSLIHI